MRAKYVTVDLKMYREVIFHDTEDSCKIWRKTDLWFGKWHEGIGKFSQETTESVKTGTLILHGNFAYSICTTDVYKM